MDEGMPLAVPKPPFDLWADIAAGWMQMPSCASDRRGFKLRAGIRFAPVLIQITLHRQLAIGSRQLPGRSARADRVLRVPVYSMFCLPVR